MLVSTDDLGILLRRPPADNAERLQWEQWITDAELLIEARLGDLTLLNQGVLLYVIREAVKAMIARPDDVTQVDIQIDDGRVSKRYETGRGRVSILDEWWSLLSPASSAAAFSIRPYGQPGFACW